MKFLNYFYVHYPILKIHCYVPTNVLLILENVLYVGNMILNLEISITV